MRLPVPKTNSCGAGAGGKSQPCDKNNELIEKRKEIEATRKQLQRNSNGNRRQKKVSLAHIDYSDKEVDDKVLLTPDSTVEYNLMRPEKHLLLHLARFETGLTKKEGPVAFDAVTQVTHYQSIDDWKQRLASRTSESFDTEVIVCHSNSSRSIKRGHCYCYRKDKRDGSWWRYNDDLVACR